MTNYSKGGFISAPGTVSWAPVGTLAPGSLSVAPPPASPATVTDFSGLPFDLAVGEVYGLRVWRVDGYGRLRARHIDTAKPWRPGVNVGECHDDGSANGWSIDRVIDPEGRGRKARECTVQAGFTSREFQITWDDGTKGVYGHINFLKPEGHQVPDEACRCGFYAYTEPDHAELGISGERMVLGVVRGTGRTLLGARGFRSEKAEIVALHDPAGAGEGSASSPGKKLREQIGRVYPDVPMLPTRSKLLEFAPVESLLPDPSTDEFWDLP